jgi:TorA maturation chaperone TorD
MISEPATYELTAKADAYAAGARLLAIEVNAPLYERLAERGFVEPRSGDELRRKVVDHAAEYCRLVIGPKPVCLPYASAHQTGTNLRSQPERRFDRVLADHGLDVTPIGELRLLARDHLAVELAALGHLYRRANAGPQLGDAGAAARTLLRERIMPWAPAVLRKLSNAARFAPYTSLLPVLEYLLEEDAMAL